MSEQQETVETKTESKSELSIKDIIAPSEKETVSVSEKQTETPKEEPKVTEAPKTEAVVENNEVKTTEAVEDPEKKVSGVLKGIQAERRKRQALEEELRQLKSQVQNSQTYYEPTAESQENAGQFENKILAISESSARSVHPDFQEKFDAFFEAAQNNPTLYDAVINSDHPGEASYQAGKALLFQKKYGTDIDSQQKAIREEAIKELKDSIRKEVEAELTGKIQTKLNQPTNLLSARTANQDAGRFQPTSFGDLLRVNRKR